MSIFAQRLSKPDAGAGARQDGAWPFAAADTPLPPGPEWLETQWQRARLQKPGRAGKVLLVLDEVQSMAAFKKCYPKAEPWLIGSDGIPLEEFFSRPAPEWFK